MGIPTGRPWLDSGGYFIVGKYSGPNPASVEDVAQEDPRYLRWIVNEVEDISEEDRDVIAAHLALRRTKR